MMLHTGVRIVAVRIVAGGVYTGTLNSAQQREGLTLTLTLTQIGECGTAI